MALKASTSDFGDAQRFIENELLSNGILDPCLKTDAHALVERKAQRLWEDDPEVGSDQNWKDAELYAKSFYENIVSAVVKRDHQSARLVLDAIEPGHQNRRWHKIVDCFETVLAVYFIEESAVDGFLAQSVR